MIRFYIYFDVRAAELGDWLGMECGIKRGAHAEHKKSGRGC